MVQGPYRYSQSQHWIEQQIGSSNPASTAAAASKANKGQGGLYVESFFSSSTEPSFYRASTSYDDANLDDDDWLVCICSIELFNAVKDTGNYIGMIRIFIYFRSIESQCEL